MVWAVGKMRDAKPTVACFYGGEYLGAKLLFVEVNLFMIGSFDRCIANLVFLTCNFVCLGGFQWLIVCSFLIIIYLTSNQTFMYK